MEKGRRFYLENDTVYTFCVPDFCRRDKVIRFNKISPQLFYFRGKTIQRKILVFKIGMP